MEWDEISICLPERTAKSCKSRYSRLQPMSEPTWTPEEDTNFIECYQDGMEWEDISKCFPGRSASICRLPYNRLKPASERPPAKPRWTPEEKAKLFRYYQAGMNWKDISTHFPGRSAGSCKSYHHRLKPASERPPAKPRRERKRGKRREAEGKRGG